MTAFGSGWRRRVRLLLFCAGCVGACGGEDPRPNVVLVSIDTLRADAVGSYGGRVDTPTLDGFAREAVLFEQAHAPAGLTAPSHASLLTGREPLEHGVIRNGSYLGDDLELLAEVFRSGGYASAAFVSSFVLDRRFGWDRGFDVFDSTFSEDEATVPKERGTPGMFFHKHDFGGFDRRADASVDAAIAWLEDAPEPYFLFVHLFDPHDPYDPPGSYTAALKGITFSLEGRRDPYAPDPVRLKRQVRRYHAEVLFTDDQLGRLFEAAVRKSDRRLLRVVTADHGEGLGQHDWVFHDRNLYQEALHVPLIVHDSASLARGIRIGTPVALSDVAPTLLDLAELPPLADATGRSLATSVRTGSEPDLRPLFAHRREHPTSSQESGRGEKLSVRSGAWKLIRSEFLGEELYDLGADPGELENRLAVAVREDPSRVGTLRRLLEVHSAKRPERGAPGEVPEEVREGLEALGYVD